ncbi:MAG: FAD-dependent oxidoreductase [Planctomycetaceae bacterium]|nr:FAD-dependent oxidoreductase [Planctomycetaceae bacterium]
MTSKINRRQLIGAIGGVSLTGVLGNESFSAQTVISNSGRNFETEILVCGGGPAGFAAATNAARLGRKVLILERYGRLGGMGICARVWPLMGGVQSPFVKEVHDKIGGNGFDPERADLHYADLLEQAGAKILLHNWVTEPIMEGNRIVGVKTVSKEGIHTVSANLVIDATGDADVAANAGVPFEMGREGDGLVQPMSIMFAVEGVADNAQYCGSEEAARATSIDNNETWETVTTRAQKNGELPETVGVVRTYKMGRRGKACVNATQINGLFGTKVEDLTNAELQCRRQVFQIVDFMRKYFPGYENIYVSHMPSVIGVRETRRICGLEQLKREDLVSGRKWDNAIVREARFSLDIHNPAGGGQAENQNQKQVQGTAGKVKPYDIPATCVIPQKIDGLLVAGRCISGSHEAHSSYRVQNICMAIGAGVGTLAAVALNDHTTPANTDMKKIQKILFQ